jgi:hypothetical protein
MWGRIEIWLMVIAGTYAFLWIIRELHIQIGKRMPDGKAKRLLLRDFGGQRGAVTAAPLLESSTWHAQQGISADVHPSGFIKRSYEQTKRDPAFRWFLVVVYAMFAPAVVAGLSFGLYFLLAWLGWV